MDKLGTATDTLDNAKSGADGALAKNDPAKNDVKPGRKGDKTVTTSTDPDEDSDEPKEKPSSLKINIKLDIDVEVHLTARVKGDITIGLL